MPPYNRTGRESPLSPADIPRPDLGRDPGVRASPVAQEVPQALDPTGKALSNVAEQLGGRYGAYGNLARGLQSFSTDMMAIGATFKALYEQKRDLEDSAGRDRAQLLNNKKTAAIETEMLNSPDALRPDFIERLDKRLAEAHKETYDELTRDGDYILSDRGRRLVDHDGMTLRVAAARRAAVQAHNQHIILRVDQGRENIAEIGKLSAQTGDFVGGWKRAEAIVNSLQDVLSPDKWRAFRDAARDVVVNQNVAAMDPYRRLNELREAPVTDDQVLDRIGGVESGGDPNARAKTSSALGTFQFVKDTWLPLLRKQRPDLAGKTDEELLALRTDPTLSRQMATVLLNENRKALKGAFNRDPTAGELYLAHFLGAPDAIKVLQAPSGTPVADLVGKEAIDANRAVLAGKTTDSVIAWSAQKMGGVIRGQGKLIDYVPEDKRLALVTGANTAVLQDERRLDSEFALEKRNVEEAIKNDLNSLANTGNGITLSPDRVRMVLGSAALAEWQDRRKLAADIWKNTDDLPFLSNTQIEERLERLRPKEASPDFTTQQQLHDAVKARADKVKELRDKDPALSVDKDPTITAAKLALKADDPTTHQAVIAARLAAQERAGIPDALRSPITREEALRFTIPLRRMLPGQEKETLTQLATDFKTLFGEHADTAFEFALRSHKIEAETAKIAARVMKKLGLGQVPTTEEVQAVDQVGEIEAAKRLVPPQPTPSIGAEIPSAPTDDPNYRPAPPAPELPEIPKRAIEALRKNPDDPSLIQQFDRKYGAGSAKKVLELGMKVPEPKK